MAYPKANGDLLPASAAKTSRRAVQMMSGRAVSGLAVALAAIACAYPGLAQEDAPEPPRILDDEPGQGSLAPLPSNRVQVLEEIVVVGSNEWRLPDLGATWRTLFERDPESRVTMRFLPLYDPEQADRMPDLFLLNKQEERTGYIELFRIRFGAEAQEASVPTVLNPDP